MTRNITNKNTNTENIDVIATKLEYVASDIREIKAIIKEMADKQDKQDNRLTSLETKTGLVGAISIAFTTIAASVAAWLGTRSS
jgi:hypothetical protein